MAGRLSFEAPRGMRDFYPEDMVWRNKVFDAFRAAGEAAQQLHERGTEEEHHDRKQDQQLSVPGDHGRPLQHALGGRHALLARVVRNRLTQRAGKALEDSLAHMVRLVAVDLAGMDVEAPLDAHRAEELLQQLPRLLGALALASLPTASKPPAPSASQHDTQGCAAHRT